MPAALSEYAAAKVNLTLRILGRRADGYHALESLVVFARLRDRVYLAPGEPAGLRVRGRTGRAAGEASDNLVLKAAHNLTAEVAGLVAGQFSLIKRLPVAAGIGGGSADAAAALRLLARHYGIAADDPRLMRAAIRTGADVPVCIVPRPRLMRGIGEVLSQPLDLPELPAVLVNPGVAVATRDVFARLGRRPGDEAPIDDPVSAIAAGAANGLDRNALIELLRRSGNDLEAPAAALEPVIGSVLDALRALPDARLARMSGSGATCFALFPTLQAASEGARRLAAQQPGWWVRPTVLGGG